jgi:hypothetical protein
VVFGEGDAYSIVKSIAVGLLDDGDAIGILLFEVLVASAGGSICYEQDLPRAVLQAAFQGDSVRPSDPVVCDGLRSCRRSKSRVARSSTADRRGLGAEHALRRRA